MELRHGHGAAPDRVAFDEPLRYRHRAAALGEDPEGVGLLVHSPGIGAGEDGKEADGQDRDGTFHERDLLCLANECSARSVARAELESMVLMGG
jgi:hypothetical protein